MTTGTRAVDPNLQQRRAVDPEKSVWVSASAGSGKTKVLTDRVLALLLAGDNPHPERILCITFTKAAAAEMSNRLNERLGHWLTLDETALTREIHQLTGRVPETDILDRARRLFARVLDTPGGLKIQTVHSFCQSLLGRFPLEAGLPPHFQVMDDRSAVEMMQRARDATLSREDAELRQALEIITRRVQEDQFSDLMRILSSERGRMRRFWAAAGGLDAMRKAVFDCLAAKEGLDEAHIYQQACDPARFDEKTLRQAAGYLLQSKKKTDVSAGEKMTHWLAQEIAERPALFGDYSLAFFNKDGSPRKSLMTKDLAKAAPNLCDAMAQEQNRLIQVKDQICRQVTAEATAALLVIGDAMLAYYEAEKQARAQLDYDDLILRARDLIAGDGRAVSWVLYKLDGGLDHILIDEAQDTNPEQWEVISALADEFFSGESAYDQQIKGPRTIFAVGDVKQSIYSFQRADPANFIDKQMHFSHKAFAAGLGWDSVPMEISFRSTGAVLGAVDQIFASPEASDGLVATGEQVRHQAYRQGQAGQVEIWPLVEQAKREEPPPWKMPDSSTDSTPDQRLAKILASRIASWIDVEKLPARGRTVRAGDILVLVRRRTALVDYLASALKALKIPVAGVDRMILSEQIVVQDLIQLGHFLCLPEDDLALANILKSPCLGLDEEALYQLAYGRSASLWQRLNELSGTREDFARVRDWLSYRLKRMDYIRPFEMYNEILTEACPVSGTDGRALSGRQAMVARLGPESEDPIEEFLNLALSFEQSHIPSLQGFLRWFDAGSAEVKRDLESASRDQVRIMTVHGAKGLQAPVVILPDTVGKPAAGKRLDIQWIQHGSFVMPLWTPGACFREKVGNAARWESKLRENQEYRRLLYVALTRAEDRLVICGYQGHKKGAEDNWYNLARRGLEGIALSVEMDFTALHDEGWAGTGLCFAEKQTATPAVATAQEKISFAASKLPDWIDRPPEAEPVPPRPLMPSRPVADEPPVMSPLSAVDGQHYQRGNLIHRLLQILPDLSADKRAVAAQHFLALPAHRLSPAQQRRLLEEVLTVLSHPDFAPVFGPGSRAEVPVTGLLQADSPGESALVLSGQIDRLLVTKKDVFIIDYKTLRPSPAKPAEVPEAYLRQLAAYRQLLEIIYPDRKIRTALLWTEQARLMEISSQLLDPFKRHP